MLEQIARVLFWLGVGEVGVKSGLIPLPAPVTGLVLLYAELFIRGRLPDELGVLADRLLRYLGMLFVPPGVGVIAHLDILKDEAIPIAAAVIGGTAITLVVTAIAVDRFGRALAKSAKSSVRRTDRIEEGIGHVKP